MKRILRVIIALIFIASGFVKAVDVVGFSFKLEEYFSPTVFNLPFFEEFALPVAIIVVFLELVLGIMLLLRLHLKKVLTGLIVLCVFFAFLTFYSAYFNKVTDCGCFGDAIKFTPWQSFIKDIILLAGLVVLWILYRKSFAENEQRSSFRKSVLVLSLVATALVIGFGIINEPLIDFRDYKIGTDLNAERKKINDDPSVYKTFYQLKNKKTGELKDVDQDEYISDKTYWDEGSPWEIQAGKETSKMVQEGYTSEISKFRLEDQNGADLTGQILQQPKVILLFSYQPAALLKDQEKATKIRSYFDQKTKQMNIPAYEVSAASERITSLPKLFMDATAIKTIGRSNPLVVVLEKGKITVKEPAVDFINNH